MAAIVYPSIPNYPISTMLHKPLQGLAFGELIPTASPLFRLIRTIKSATQKEMTKLVSSGSWIVVNIISLKNIDYFILASASEIDGSSSGLMGGLSESHDTEHSV